MAQGQGFDPIVLILLFGGMFVWMYFSSIRPQQKKQKELEASIDGLTKGGEIVTTGGIFGKVTKIKEGYLYIEVAPEVEILIERKAVSRVLPNGTIKSI